MHEVELLINNKILSKDSCFYSNCNDLINKIAIEDNGKKIIFCFYCLNHDNDTYNSDEIETIDIASINNIDIKEIKKIINKVEKYLMLK